MKKTYFLLSVLGAAICAQAFAAPLVVDGTEREINVPSGTVAQPSDSPISAVNGGHLVLNVQAGQLNMLPSAEPGYVALSVSGQGADGAASSMELYSAQSFFLNGYKTPDTHTGISVQDGGSMLIATKGNYNLNTGSAVAVGAGSTLTFKGQGSYTTANIVGTHIDNSGTVTFKLNGNGGWATGISGVSSVQNREGAVFEADGLLLSGGSTFVNDGTVTGHKVIVQDAGTVFTNNGTLSNNSTQFSVTYGGKLINNAGGTVTENTFSGGLTMYANEQLAAEVENHGTLSLNYGGTLSGTNAVLTNAEGGTLELKTSKTLTLGKKGSTDAVKLVNEGTLKMSYGASVVVNGSSLLDNSGTMEATSGKIVLNDSGRLVTGNLAVGNRAAGQDAAETLDYTFADGLKGVTVQVNAGTGLSEVGTHIVSANENKQFITGDDLKLINSLVLSDLKLTSVSPDRLKVVNILRESVEAAATTKDFTDGTISTVVHGATLTVEKDAESAEAATLGSVTADGMGSAASIRLDSDTKETNTVVWKGAALKTISGEQTLISETSAVTVGVTAEGGAEQHGTGTLVVSADSELTVKGEVKANVETESNAKLTNDRLISGNLHVATSSEASNSAGGSISGDVRVDGVMTNNGAIQGETTVTGTLKGSGVLAATTIAETATLIVGNSPGYTTFTDALLVESGASVVFSVSGVEVPASLSNGTGWESHTYSQIVMENAPVTLCDGVNITIAFGGDALCSTLAPLNEAQVTPFELVLIKGGVASTLDLVSLMEHTSFVLSSEEGALPLVLTGQTWALNVADAAYRVDNGNLVLSGKLGINRIPEPATTTLSLLALAALSARRRR
ncbi:MAG: autotransporter adhesin family protein [Akkermansia sp.]|nr:autotransporter adhesin family protein [Akkermansia sp.]